MMSWSATLGVLLAVLAWLTPTVTRATDIKEVTTPLGIKAWLVEDRSVPVVTLSFSFATGAATDPVNQRGVTSLMTALLTDGAGSLDAQAFKRRLEESAAFLNFGASQDRLGGSLRVLSASRQEGFELLRLALTQPRFDGDMIEQRRAQFIAGLKQADQRPAAVAERTAMGALFADHPYAGDPHGTPESLAVLKAADIKARAASALDRNGLIVAAVGDIGAGELVQLLDWVFGALPAGAARPLPAQWAANVKQRTMVVERPVPQSVVRLVMPAIPRDDPDWYVAVVMAHILGGGQQSRLFNEVRAKRGLAYSVSAGLRTYKRASLLSISTASANERVAEAVRVIRGEMGRLRTESVGDAELADAKSYLIGALPVSLTSSSSVASLLHSLQLDGLPSDYLDKRASLFTAVGLEDVRRVAQRLLRDAAVVSVVVGKPVGLATEP